MAVSLKHHHNCQYYLIHLLSILLILPVQTTTSQCYTDADIALYQQHTPSWIFQDTCNQCLANFTLYNENDIDDIPRKGLTCSKKDSTAVDSMWFYNGTVINCETGNFNNFSFCERSQPGSITLYTKFSGESGGWPEGLYTCCIEGSCISTRVYLQDNATKYFITGKTAIVESCTIDPPNSISQVPQEYTLRMVTSGIPPALLSAAINCTNKYGGTKCGKSHYTLLDLEHERFQYSVPVTWNGNSDFTEHYYNCTANYGVRFDRVEVSYSQLVEIRAPRSAPTSASYMILNSTSVIVNWEINEEQQAINGSVINLTSEEDSSRTVVIRDPSARSYIVNNLVIDREYQISIRGFLDLIGSAITVTVRLEVPQLSFLTIQSNTSSFTAQWSVEDQPNSTHTSTSFTLVYTSLCDYTSRTLIVTDVYNVTVDKLSPGISYRVTITPSNSVGIGDNETVVIPLLNIEPPTAAPVLRSLQVVNASTVRVSWDRVDCDSRNSDIIDYRIMYANRKPTEHMNVFDFNWENEETSYDVIGLQGGTEYKFQIAAVNGAGVGPYSSSLAVYTINTTITDLRSQESIAIIELSWQPESGQPSDISLQYEVVYAITNTSRNTTSNGGLLETYISYCNTTNSSVIVTGLQSNTWYVFGVRIIESASVTVYEFTSIVLKTKSESIDLLSTIVFNTSTTVSLTWSPLPDTPIDEYLYDVGYSTCSNDQTSECTWSANDHSIDAFNKTYTMYTSTAVVGEKEVVSIPELTPGSCYLFGVRIRSLKGDRYVGGWNIVRNFTTASAQVSSSTDDGHHLLVIIIAVSVTAGILLVLVLCLTGTTMSLIRSNKLLKEELAIVTLKYNSYSTLDSILERDDNRSKKRSHRQYRKNTINGNLTTNELQHSLLTNKPPAPISEYANDDDMSPFYNECASNDDIYDRITDVRPNKTPTYLEIHN